MRLTVQNKQFVRLLGSAMMCLVLTTGCATTTQSSGPSDGMMDDMRAATAEARKAAKEAREAAARASRTPSRGQQVRRSGNYYQPDLRDDQTAGMVAFPTGDPATSALLVHQVMPKQVRKGQEYSFEYHLTNLTSDTLQAVNLDASGFQNLTLISSNPGGDMGGGGVTWNIGDIPPGATKKIVAKGKSASTGTASACLSAAFSKSLCASTIVVEPSLKLTKEATPRTLVCNEIMLKYVVSNPGSGVAQNVQITDDLPNGLKTVDGRSRVQANVGNLAPKQSKEVLVKAKASSIGEYESGATATATGGVTAESNDTTTVVQQPKLAITTNCPKTRYIGRDVEFEYKVTNTGNAVAANTIVDATIPAGTKVKGAAPQASANSQVVSWNLGSLSPGSSRTMTMSVTPSTPSTLLSKATAKAECATPVSDSCQTDVRGIPAILMEVVDLEDPIEVGENVTYVVTITNQGSAVDTNIRITCDIPNASRYVSSSGATRGSAQGQKLTFAPLPSLAPKEKAQWRIIVTAVEEGDIRFAVQLDSDQLTRPVNENEATFHYK